MSKTPSPSGRSMEPRRGSLAWGGGVALLIVVCCAAPALIAGGVAAGALGALGAWLSSQWVIGLAVALAALVVVRLASHAGRRGPATGQRHDCCPPTQQEPPVRTQRPERNADPGPTRRLRDPDLALPSPEACAPARNPAAGQAARDQSAALTIVQPQQHVGASVPLHVGGAGLVTVSSQPQSSFGQTYTSPSTNGITAHLSSTSTRPRGLARPSLDPSPRGKVKRRPSAEDGPRRGRSTRCGPSARQPIGRA